LTPKTKALIGIGIMGYAVAGLYLSDTAEEKFGMKATDEDRAKLREVIPTMPNEVSYGTILPSMFMSCA
jgi:hypothetical protein